MQSTSANQTTSTHQLNRQTFVDQDALNLTESTPSLTIASTHFSASQHENEEDMMSHTSAYSYRTEADASRFLHEVEGRRFNTLNETYLFPSDEGESARLNKRHVSLVLAHGGLYPAADTVVHILAPQDGEQKRILDLGAGTGIWAIDMAKKFPHCQIVGIDLVPISVEADSIPPNCQFEIDDVELGLQHFQNQFDLVHVRFLVMGLKDLRKSMADIHRCLKPGGLVIWIEPDFNLFTEDIHVYRPLGSELDGNGTWAGRIMYEVKRASVSVSGSDLSVMEDVLDRGLWGDLILDSNTCKSGSLYMPIGPWADHEDVSMAQRLKYIGALNRQDLYDQHRAAQILLERAGWSSDTLAEWTRLAKEELFGMGTPQLVRMRVNWGRRRGARDGPATRPPSKSVAATAEDPFATFDPYPLFYIYHTQEQALTEHAIRTRSKDGYISPPLPD